jgi:RNA ligase (TIGR02306 family)
MIVATIGQVVSVNPVENSDRLAQAVVVCGKAGRWTGVVARGEVQAGQLVEVYLPDALLPQSDPRFTFMEKYQWRVRIARLRGALSECLVMPLTVEPPEIGADIASLVGVQKYEKPVPLSVRGELAGAFPSVIPKTAEPHFQAVQHLVIALQGKPWYATAKLDGASATFYRYQGEFGVCSRNWRLRETSGSLAWHLAKQYNLPQSVEEGLVIQAEMVGPGVLHDNPLRLKEPDLRVFNAFRIEGHAYVSVYEDVRVGSFLGVPTVNLVASGDSFPALSDDELRAMAAGEYLSGGPREGIVIRPQFEAQVDGDRLSFKVINPAYGK